MAECLKVDGFHPMFENTGSPAFFIVDKNALKPNIGKRILAEVKAV